jgi:hypothetical protein
MSNTFLTPSVIAKEALMVLKNNLVFGGLVHRDYSDEFSAKIGDTVTIRKPATFVANEFVEADGISVQTATEGSTTVKLDKHLDVSFEITSKELSLSLQDFSEQVLQPAMSAFGQKIDSYVAALYKDIPYVAGTAGTTPATAAAIANSGKVLNINKAPMLGRNMVIDPEAQASLIVLDSFMEVDKAGTSQALREANLGRLLGFDTYMDQNINKHTIGTLSAGEGKVLVKGTVAAGAKTATLDSTTLTGTLVVGDIFTVGGNPYVVTKAAEAASNEIAVEFYPASAGFADNAEVTLIAKHTANLGFHKNAFALVTRPLALPLGNSNAQYVSYDGLGLRVVQDYDSKYKKDVISLDMLCGVKTLTPELAVRLLG